MYQTFQYGAPPHNITSWKRCVLWPQQTFFTSTSVLLGRWKCWIWLTPSLGPLAIDFHKILASHLSSKVIYGQPLRHLQLFVASLMVSVSKTAWPPLSKTFVSNNIISHLHVIANGVVFKDRETTTKKIITLSDTTATLSSNSGWEDSVITSSIPHENIHITLWIQLHYI